MLTLLISNDSNSVEEWQKLIESASRESSFQTSLEISLKKDTTKLLLSDKSICGLEVLLQNNGLKIFLNSLPSRADLRFFIKIIEMSSKQTATFSDDSIKQSLLNSDFNDKFNEIWHAAAKEAELTISREARNIDLKSWLIFDEEPNQQEKELIKILNSLSSAKEPEVFPVDDKESAIWDGDSTWIPQDVDMILFSQKHFQGKVCGEISSESLKRVLSERVIHGLNGFMLPDSKELTDEDFESINAELKHYEKKEIKKKLEKLTIEVGKLEEISYSMSRALFEGVKLSKITDNYIKAGISKAQLEVAALAVSSMLEIAATSRGSSLDSMQNKLKNKCKLSAEAAYAVASGFVNAAQEAKPPKAKINWLKLAILIFAAGTLIWFFFFR